MKLLIIIAALAFGSICSFGNDSATANLSLFVELADSSTSFPTSRVGIKLNLKNNSADTIRLWMMKCSWQLNFMVNNDAVSFEASACNGNFPVRITVLPKQDLRFEGSLLLSTRDGNQPGSALVDETKLGFIVITSRECFNSVQYWKLLDDKSKWKIIWSNALYLNYGKQRSSIRKASS